MLGAGLQGKTGAADRGAQANSRERVVQAAPLAAVHLHAATGNQRHPQLSPQLPQVLPALPVAAVQSAVNAQPGTSGKTLLYPFPCVLYHAVATSVCIGPDQQTASQRRQVVMLNSVPALAGPASCPADQCGQITVAAAVGCQQHQSWAVVELEFTADNQVQHRFTCSQVGTHHPRQRALIA